MADVLQNPPVIGMKKRFPRPFGRYILEKSLSRGGMGEVMLAIPRGAMNRCVIKTIRGDLIGDQEFVGRFADEAKIMVRINHENIIRVFDAGKVGPDYYIAMEFVYGRDLGDVLDRAYERGEPMPLQLGLYVTSELMKGLEYAHHLTDEHGRHMGLVHRDISPQNVLVGFDGAIKLIDFGLARTEILPGRTQGALAVGKYGYMSPEQARHEDIDGRADIYSAGVMLFEVFTGDRLVDEQDQATLWSRVLNPKHRHPRSVIPSLPAEIDELVMRAVEVRPEDRYQSAAKMRTFVDSLRSVDSDRRAMANYLRFLYPKVDFQPPPVPDMSDFGLGSEKSVIIATSREVARSVFGRGDLPIEWTMQIDTHEVRQELKRRGVPPPSRSSEEWIETTHEASLEPPHPDAVLDTRRLGKGTIRDRIGHEQATQVSLFPGYPELSSDPPEDFVAEETVQSHPVHGRNNRPYRDEEMTVMMSAPPTPMVRPIVGAGGIPGSDRPPLVVSASVSTPEVSSPSPAAWRQRGDRGRHVPVDPSKKSAHAHFAVHRQTVGTGGRQTAQETAPVPAFGRSKNEKRATDPRRRERQKWPPPEPVPGSTASSGWLFSGVILFGLALLIFVLVVMFRNPG